VRIWLVTIGEPLPIDGNSVRLHRTGILANLLADNGHEVLWWTSTFDHFHKRQRFKKDTKIDLKSGLKVWLLHSIRYRRNISLLRIVNHYRIARKFSKYIPQETRPDIVLCSFPTLWLSYVAIQYGKKNNVPVVIDARDMWPDIFLNIVSGPVRWLMRIALRPAFKRTGEAFSGAYAVTGMTPAFVEWGLEYAGRERGKFDRDFPLGYIQNPPDEKAIGEAKELWEQYGVGKSKNEFIVCFFGTIGKRFKLEPVIEAARLLQERELPIRFVICGDGDRLHFYRRMAEGCSNVIFPGWIGGAEIWTLMRMSSAGLAPYISTRDFRSSIPNKIIEYFSAGLPVLSSLKGMVQDLLEEHECGITYEAGSVHVLMQTLLHLYEYPDERERMSKKAHRLFSDRFTAERVYRNMMKYLQTVADSYLSPETL
jgi:glycosyltransferase involved in cell wall biosynthesis